MRWDDFWRAWEALYRGCNWASSEALGILLRAFDST